MKFVFKSQPSHSYHSCVATRDLELDKICWGSKKVFCVKSKQRHRFVLLFELMDKHIQNRFRWLYNNDACYIKNRRQAESGPGSWITIQEYKYITIHSYILLRILNFKPQRKRTRQRSVWGRTWTNVLHSGRTSLTSPLYHIWTIWDWASFCWTCQNQPSKLIPAGADL